MSTSVSMCVYIGMSQLRVSQNTNFPRLWITKVPSDILISCSHAFLWNSEEDGSQIFTLASCLPVPFFVNLWNTEQVTEDPKAPKCVLGSPKRLLALEAHAFPVILSKCLNAWSMLHCCLFWHYDKMTEHLSFWIWCCHLSFRMEFFFFFPPA